MSAINPLSVATQGVAATFGELHVSEQGLVATGGDLVGGKIMLSAKIRDPLVVSLLLSGSVDVSAGLFGTVATSVRHAATVTVSAKLVSQLDTDLSEDC